MGFKGRVCMAVGRVVTNRYSAENTDESRL